MPLTPLTHALLRSASPGVLTIAMSAAACGQAGEEVPRGAPNFGARNLVARIQFWLRLIWGGICGREVEIIAHRLTSAPPLNRHKTRLARRRLPLSRRWSGLYEAIYAARGPKGFVQWLYRYSLTPRVRWCFIGWAWRWASRAVIALSVFRGDNALRGKAFANGADGCAPLSPD